jgi:hypothetical protein
MSVMRINLWGGPGVGKTTAALRLVAEIRAAGALLEYVPEVMKDWAWDGRRPVGYQRIGVFADQLAAEERPLRNGIPIVTDSPLGLLPDYDDQSSYVPGLLLLAAAFEADYPSLDVYFRRTLPYDHRGRFQTEAQAHQVDEKILAILQEAGRPYLTVDPTADLGPLQARLLTALAPVAR